jgi:hypothetical protein
LQWDAGDFEVLQFVQQDRGFHPDEAHFHQVFYCLHVGERLPVDLVLPESFRVFGHVQVGQQQRNLSHRQRLQRTGAGRRDLPCGFDDWQWSRHAFCGSCRDHVCLDDLLLNRRLKPLLDLLVQHGDL